MKQNQSLEMRFHRMRILVAARALGYDGLVDIDALKCVRLHVGCRWIDKDAGKRKTKGQKRIYAHTGHMKNRVCVASDFEDLPYPQQTGILLHELGHVASPDKSEPAADMTIKDLLDIEIKYTKRYELQTVSRADINLYKNIF